MLRQGGKGLARAWIATLVVPACASPVFASSHLTPERVTAILASLHPDHEQYIGEVRFGSTRLRPSNLYAGLVRRGGRDPRDPEDRPEIGKGATNDLIIFADTFEPWRTPAWRLLLADHEYFHARHLARGFAIPVVGFGDPGVDTDYYEALAWGYVKDRASAGLYGELSPRESAEVNARYEEHYSRFHRFVLRRQASAWAHYGRFFPQPEPLRSALPVPPEATSPPAGQATAPGTPSGLR